MATITCPRCGTENPDGRINCQKCGIDLRWALENPTEVERLKAEEEHATEPREAAERATVASGPCRLCGQIGALEWQKLYAGVTPRLKRMDLHYLNVLLCENCRRERKKAMRRVYIWAFLIGLALGGLIVALTEETPCLTVVGPLALVLSVFLNQNQIMYEFVDGPLIQRMKRR